MNKEVNKEVQRLMNNFNLSWNEANVIRCILENNMVEAKEYLEEIGFIDSDTKDYLDKKIKEKEEKNKPQYPEYINTNPIDPINITYTDLKKNKLYPY